MLAQNAREGRRRERSPHHVRPLGHSKDRGVIVGENGEPLRSSEHRVSRSDLGITRIGLAVNVENKP